MLYKENGKWKLCSLIVEYEQNGEKQERYTADQDWWEKTAEKHEHIKILSFKEASYTEDQHKRLELLNLIRIPESFMADCIEYVKNGVFPERLNSPLWPLKTDINVGEMKPIKLQANKQQIKTDGEDTAIITGELPAEFEKIHVLVNSPPPVYEETNDGEIEIEFTTEDEGFHIIEVTAGNKRGLIVIEGVSE